MPINPKQARWRIVVYERVGAGFLHRACLKVKLLWTVTLLVAGIITLFS